MANFCLTKQASENLKKAFRDGLIDPEKIASISSEERRAILEKYVGKENAHQVNALFESKLLLKNQKAGYIAWAKKVTGITPEVRRDLLAKIERLDKVLDPKDEQKFLEDLARAKLGLDVTQTEAKNIADLSKQVTDSRAKAKEDGSFSSEKDRLDYGAAKVALANYFGDLKNRTTELSVKDRLNPKNVVINVSDVAGIAKSVKASLDNSALLRQGWKTLWTHPKIWQRNALKSFSDITRTLGNKPVMDGIMADIVSRPTYDKMVKAKLAIGNIEEAYPSTLPEKVPLFGKVYKASENAFTGFVYRQRADVFDSYLQIAEKSGINIDDIEELKPIASMVNSLTGRGNLGKYEGSAANLINNIFFSPRFLKSQIDTFGHVVTGAGGSKFVKKQAAINLLKVVSGTAAIMVIANAVKPGSVELDSRSSNFGKIKSGNTTFDITGGMSSITTLVTRLISHSTKSTTSGNINPLDSGKFGAQTTKDVVFNFAANKFSPAASFLLQLRSGTDAIGNKTTSIDAIKTLIEPLPFSNIEQSLKDPKSANILLTMIADGLGISANTNTPAQKTWSNNPTKSQQQFLDKVGQDKFNQANNDYNNSYSAWLDKVSQTSSYKSLSPDLQQSLQTKAKATFEAKIFKKYGFVYKNSKSTAVQKNDNNNIKKLLP